MYEFIASEGSEGLRLDSFLADNIPGYTREFIKKSISDKVKVNNKLVKPSYKLKLNDKVSADIKKVEDRKVKPIKLGIIYEDDNCLVIDKPTGVLSHSKGQFNEEATVESFISNKTSGFVGPRAGIVHRLDRATSGVMICAKTPESHVWLQKQFSTRKVSKEYVAIVAGHMSKSEAIIDMPIGRNPKAPATFRVSSNGKSAITRYRVDKTSEKRSMLMLNPKTGRTHQLRVHLAYLGHPILGDSLYKGEPSDRLYLHASRLEIKLPDQKMHVFEVNLPISFGRALEDSNG